MKFSDAMIKMIKDDQRWESLAGKQPGDFQEMIAKTKAQIELFLSRAANHGDVEDIEWKGIQASIAYLNVIDARITGILEGDAEESADD